MKKIKLFEGVGVMSKGEYTKTESVSELWELLNLNVSEKKKDEMRTEITRSLVGMGYCVLTDDTGFPIFLQIIPTKKEERNGEKK